VFSKVAASLETASNRVSLRSLEYSCHFLTVSYVISEILNKKIRVLSRLYKSFWISLNNEAYCRKMEIL